ncbi:hypothetical protein ACQEVZ_05530 [Dactylosporangium sp. CA-152071]|uniref:hypothetical protein n=1 Tax=Dactylosporangium sp. CA-152071 TaxID=3239933 RepID=UPI003D918F5B
MVDAADTVTLSVMQRNALSLSGLALGLMPGTQGAWIPAAAAAMAGLMVLGVWTQTTQSRLPIALAVWTGLAIAMAAGFVVSQWSRGHLLQAPAKDYFGFWALAGLAALLALLVEHRAQRGPKPVTVALGMAAVAGLVLVFVGVDSFGPRRFEASRAEALPLPATLRLVSFDACAASGSSGNCTAAVVVTAADGAGKTEVLERLAVHLRALGWPLVAGPAGYYGCRDTGGLWSWTQHCLSMGTGAEPQKHPSDAVVVHIDNE